MSIFTGNKNRDQDEPAKPLNLPAGYDNPDSDWYIPDEAHQPYAAVDLDYTDVADQAEQLMKATLADWVREERRKLDEPRRNNIGQPIGAKGGTRSQHEALAVEWKNRLEVLRRTRLPEFTARAEHNLRLTAAMREVDQAEQFAASQRAWDAAHTCAYCGNVRSSTFTGVVVRELVGSFADESNATRITACRACRAGLLAELDRQTAQTRTATTTARIRDQVQEWLED